MVSSTSFLCPFMICEVVSQRSESDRFRMLVQGIALARVGQCFMPSGEKFFVVAIYLRANLTAERYIVTQPGADRKVFIVQKNFDLTKANEAVAFLREMYNLAQEFDDLAGKIDPKNKTRLGNIKIAASKVISLTSQAQHNKTPRTTLASVFEENREASGAQDDLGVFDADGIQGILKKMDYQISFIVFGHPFLALVSNIENDSQQGYLKFVKEGQKEVEILRYLTGIESPSNYTISPVQIWPVQGGNVISMPMAGGHLTSLSNAGAHLWPVAEQLFKAVDFMHEHGVAHLDLKPPNILLPADGGRLSIIDFNRSVRVKGTETMFRGIVGTTGYLAPEVAAGQGLYSAIRADLWSCGKTLEELCSLCSPSRDRNALLEIARELMNEDPRQRPMMSDVLNRLAYYKVNANTGPGYFR
ncbi:kinase-like domain-containing protein [Suillus plorans]|uniref:non-specific serine/threonine protein kinase n=1 Tax=Suillus plorans TaxID=116603 RepID=A0A9P7AI62_9AGAM|nr:kinase-like domain-containing protein [Suillus plorans]KAG1789319.1 kinase-like domain-containing protein [Suillus plorans]